MQKTTAKIGVFWGSFDPPTKAHKAIIIKMLKLFHKVLIIVNNREEDYFASIEHRKNMLHSMLSNAINKYKILQQDVTHVNDYFNLQQQFSGSLYVVAGIDAVKAWLNSHDISELANYDGLYVVPRNLDIAIDIANVINVFQLSIKLSYQCVSSTRVRSKLATLTNAAQLVELDSNVLAYIKQHKLYHRL